MAILIVEAAMDLAVPELEAVVKPAVAQRFAAHKWAPELTLRPARLTSLQV